MSVDPVAPSLTTGGNFNRYWYANANPYTFIDPDGRQVSINYNQPGTPGYVYAERYENAPNELSASGHGDNRGVWDDRGRVGSAQEGRKHKQAQAVASDFQSLPDYSADKVLVLLNCRAGDGDNSFAQQVSDITGNTVRAGSDRVEGRSDGTFSPFHDSNDNRQRDAGEQDTPMKTFTPAQPQPSPPSPSNSRL